MHRAPCCALCCALCCCHVACHALVRRPCTHATAPLVHPNRNASATPYTLQLHLQVPPRLDGIKVFDFPGSDEQLMMELAVSWGSASQVCVRCSAGRIACTHACIAQLRVPSACAAAAASTRTQSH